MRFYLGTHETSWLERLDVPLFISHRRFARLKRWLPVARTGWALDSGGFTELGTYGRWRTTVNEYVEAVERYRQQIGRLEWAAPMDWMCEPHMIDKTGLSVREHQERTVASYLELRDRGPFIPVLQGWTQADYERCAHLYSEAGVDLVAQPLVGLGTVCRREATDEIVDLVRCLSEHGLRLHGFGMKKGGLRNVGPLLASADSMAWSTRGRQAWHHDRRRACGNHRDHNGGRSCANCPAWALQWRSQLPLETRQAPEGACRRNRQVPSHKENDTG